MLETRTSRRQFLFKSAKAAVGITISLQGMSWITGCSSDNPTEPTGIWKDLQGALKGQLLQSGSMDYFTIAKPWALQYSGTMPGGIARCVDEADVQTCINWARKNKVAIVARSGGHSYGGYSMTTGLMVDVSLMNNVSYDSATGNAVVGGGARNKDVYAALRAPSVAVTHGRCKEVGVAGLVLGGGIGFNMRAHGLTCDQLVSTRIVTADGAAKVCSATENANLFWAVRGAGGGNYGIHTEFTFRPFPVNTITVFNIYWDTKTREVFEVLQAMLVAAPSTVGAKLSVSVMRDGPENAVTVSLLGQYVGPKSDVISMLSEVYSVAAPFSQDILEKSYWDGQEFLSEEGAPEYSHERSRFAYGAISNSGIDAIFRNIDAWPGTRVAGTWKFFLMGDAIKNTSAQETAFVHRDAAMITSIELEWLPEDQGADLEANFAWLDAFHNEMEQYTSAECYQNFIDRRQNNYLEAYYGTNLARLQQVKQQVDPTNMFTYPQAIPLP